MSPFLRDLLERLSSRKFILALAAILLIIGNAEGSLSGENLSQIVAIVLGYLGVEGLGDASERYGLARSDVRIENADTVTTANTDVTTTGSDTIVNVPEIEKPKKK
jgi:hypothetical protein